VNRPESALAALLFSVVIVAPAAAQQAPLMPQPAVSEFCSGCFAYLEFSPSLEPESYATRGQETETPKSLPAEGEPSDRLRERRVGLFASSKQ
jgi:hypothetical protein